MSSDLQDRPAATMADGCGMVLIGLAAIVVVAVVGFGAWLGLGALP